MGLLGVVRWGTNGAQTCVIHLRSQISLFSKPPTLASRVWLTTRGCDTVGPSVISTSLVGVATRARASPERAHSKRSQDQSSNSKKAKKIFCNIITFWCRMKRRVGTIIEMKSCWPVNESAITPLLDAYCYASRRVITTFRYYYDWKLARRRRRRTRRRSVLVDVTRRCCHCFRSKLDCTPSPIT